MCSTTHSVTRKEMASFLEVNFALCTRRGCAATLRSFQAKTSKIRSATNVPLLFLPLLRFAQWGKNLFESESIVFCYQNCSDLLREKIVLVIEKNFWNSRLKAENLQIFEITRTIYSNSERSEQFLVTECFFNLFLEVSHI